MKIEVLSTVWAAGDQEFPGGTHDVTLTAKLAPLIAGAEAAAAIRVLDATSAERKQLDRHVQSQDAGEKANARALEDGSWRHGNLVQFVADREDRLTDDDLSKRDRARLEQELAEAKAALEQVEVPT